MARGRFTQPLDMYHTNYNADITGIRPHWRMNINSGHTLTYNTWTKLQFGGNNYGMDEGTAYSGYMGVNSTDDRFQVGLGGTYYCKMLLMLASANKDRHRFDIYFRRSGETVDHPQRLITLPDMDGNAVFHTMTHSQLVQMQEGQYLEVWVKARSAAATVYSSQGWSFFEGIYLGPGDAASYDALNYTQNN